MTIHAPSACVALPVVGRRLLTAVFAALGVVMAVFGARMPAVKAAADLSTGQLSLVLLGAATGMVAGLQIGGRLAHRRPSSELLVGPTIAFGIALVLLGQSRSLPTLAVSALVFGLAHGLLDVGANVTAVACERAYKRPIMGSLHSSFSLGALGGAALAAVTTQVSYHLVFLAVGTATVMAAVVASPLVRRTPFGDTSAPADQAESEQVSSMPGPVWLLGALAAACLLGEGAAADWSAVHLRSLHTGEATAAAAYALYSAAMAAGRMAGDRLVARFGAPSVVRAGSVLAALGLGAGLAIGTAPTALVGWAALGAGLSTAVPSLITAAGRGGPRAVGTVAATGYLGLLIGPAVIGAVASITSLTAALFLPVALAAAVALMSHRVLESR